MPGVEDPARTPQRLLERLSTEERLWLLDGDTPLWRGLAAMAKRYNAAPVPAGEIERLGLPGIRFTDGPRGVAVGASTSFPVAIARGATWDPALEEEIGRAIGREARAQGANLFAGVCVNLLRHPAWGRAQETYGEDPVLLGAMGAALTRGVRESVMACVKHFALNSIEDARFEVDVVVDEEALHEVYLPHFKAVVDAGAEAVMSAYNRVNGEWAGENASLLTEVLRDEWGFEGIVISDFIWGLRDPVASLRAGLDVEMPFRQQRARALPRALAEGRLAQEDVDRAASRVLAVQLGYERRREPAPDDAVVACAEHRELARRAATRGMVLLRNESAKGSPGMALMRRPVLPLEPARVGRLAVLGRLARAANLGDGGSSAVHPPSTATPLEGLRAAYPATSVLHEDGADIASAATAASYADAAVVVVGLSSRDEGESMLALDAGALATMGPPLNTWLAGRLVPRLLRRLAERVGFRGGDRDRLALHRHDEELIGAVAAANDRTIVVVIGGSAVTMEEWRGSVAAILLAWYPGMEGGHAIADVLSGAAEPGGRLPMAIPRDESDLPFFDSRGERIEYDRWWGQRKLDRDGHHAAFPLGFGLGYTDFVPERLELDPPRFDPAAPGCGSLTARLVLENRGPRDGATVVQLYASGGEGLPPERRCRQLLGFRRVEVPQGGSVEVTIEGALQPLCRRDPATGAWAPVAGDYRVEAAQFCGDPDAIAATVSLAAAPDAEPGRGPR